MRLLLAGWALAVVSSRAFRLRGLSQPATLLPLIDMANHSFTPNAEVVLVGDSAVMRATQQVGIRWRVSGLGHAAAPGVALQHQLGRYRSVPIFHVGNRVCPRT
jgi:hypothetical protein